MIAPPGGARSSSASKGKVKIWGNEYEKLGVAIMNHVKRCDAQDDEDFIVKDEIGKLENAIRGKATHVVGKKASSAFNLPELVINDTITNTYGYPGINLGDLVTLEYERLRAWREGDNLRTVFFSKEFLESSVCVCVFADMCVAAELNEKFS